MSICFDCGTASLQVGAEVEVLGDELWDDSEREAQSSMDESMHEDAV